MAHDNGAAVSAVLNTLSGVYRDPTRVYSDAAALLRDPVGRHLRPTTGDLVESDGSHHPALFVFRGTVPMDYRGVTYHVPVDMYLPPPYPVRPPVCFVRPVETMMIKERHRHVGRDGMVYLPYLHQWRPNPRSHNLSTMVRTMVDVFGQEPPVFAKPTTTATPSTSATTVARPTSATTTTTASASANGDYGRADSMEAAIEASRLEEEERRRKAQLEQDRLEIARHESMEQAALAKTAQEARERLTGKLRAHLAAFYGGLRDEVTEDYRNQRRLEENAARVESHLAALEERRDALRTSGAALEENNDDLRVWLAEADARDADADAPDENDLVVPADQPSARMLELAAESAAVTDCLYYLDKALVRGTIPMEVHIKKVRRLAKKQFLAKALLVKISEERAMAAHRDRRRRDDV